MRRAIRFASTVAVAAMLTGCADSQQAPDPAARYDKYIGGYANGYFIAGQAGCGARRLQGLVGQDASALNAASVPYGTRVLFPGSPQQTGYDPNRMTVTIDGASRISNVACG